jgi:hypothetical protein
LVLVEQEMEKVIARYSVYLNHVVEQDETLVPVVRQLVEILLKIYPPKAAAHLLVL